METEDADVDGGLVLVVFDAANEVDAPAVDDVVVVVVEHMYCVILHVFNCRPE